MTRARAEGEILLSAPVLTELREVLARKHLRRYFGDEEALDFIDALIDDGRWVDVDVEIAACRDPKDDKFLSLAVSGAATHIITGDQDLLALDPFQGIRIVTPQDFLAFP